MNLEYAIINTRHAKIDAHSGIKGQRMSIDSWREENSSIAAHCLRNLKITKTFEQGFCNFTRFMAKTFATIFEFSSRIIDTFRLHYRPCLQVSGIIKYHIPVVFDNAEKQSLLESLPFRLHVSMARYAKVYALLLDPLGLSCKGGVAPFDPPFQKTHGTVFFDSLGEAAL